MSERSKEHASKACEVKASASSNLASSATKPPKSCTSGALRWCGSRIACYRVRQATRVWRHHQYLWLGWHGSGRQYRRDIPLGAYGWIFFTERALENEGEVLQQPYPVVLGGDYLSYGKCDQVTMPNTEAVRFAVGRLLDTGVRTIAVIGASPDMHGWEDVRDQRDGTQSLRIQGYVQAHEERGLTWIGGMSFLCSAGTSMAACRPRHPCWIRCRALRRCCVSTMPSRSVLFTNCSGVGCEYRPMYNSSASTMCRNPSTRCRR